MEQGQDSEKEERPRAYEESPYLWRFQDLPLTDENNPEDVHPLRQSAVFVVHGMGEQAYLDTAVTLRDGFEHAIKGMHGKTQGNTSSTAQEQPHTPVPFTFEGYWADYAEIEKTFPAEWGTFNERERRLFSELWRRRVMSRLRTFWWFIKRSYDLLRNKDVSMFEARVSPDDAGDLGVRGRLVRRFFYYIVGILGFISSVYILLRHPRIMGTVLADIRVYLEPEGDIEKAIVQRIDYRVGEQFLKLLGLDWNFRSLFGDQALKISGRPHSFTHVTWVAHSLGSVISYNVISDLLTRCVELQTELAGRGPEVNWSLRDRELKRNIDRVEKGLHRFFTIGSPLNKVAALFPDILRKWPKTYQTTLNVSEDKKPRRWWVNFYNVWDPVSSQFQPRDGEMFGPAKNIHGTFRQLPFIAHMGYWHDLFVLRHIISRAYGSSTLSFPEEAEEEFREPGWAERARFNVVAFSMLAVVILGLLVGADRAFFLVKQTIALLVPIIGSFL